MKRYGILFSPAMVLALLAGRKRVTRRLDKRWLRVKTGDELWVRETWRPETAHSHGINVTYAADGESRYFADDEINPEWTIPKAAATGNVSPLFMPRWASRITLVATEDARAERLHDITDEEAKAEGLPLPLQVNNAGGMSAGRHFEYLWSDLHTKPGELWSDNPEVVRMAFDVKVAA